MGPGDDVPVVQAPTFSDGTSATYTLTTNFYDHNNNLLGTTSNMFSSESASHPIHGEYTRSVRYNDPARPVINDGTLRNIANLPSVSDYRLTARYGTPEPSISSGSGLLNASGANPLVIMGGVALAAAEEGAAFALGEAIGYGLAATVAVLTGPEILLAAVAVSVVVGTAALIDEYARTKPLNPPIAIPISVPTDMTKPKEEEQGTVLYRSMKMDGIGTPLIEESARGLGVRPNDDIPILAGWVTNLTGGMSVAPDNPNNLPSHRRPSELGGTGKDAIFEINSKNLPIGLSYIPDGPKHGTIQPSFPMTYVMYNNLLSLTKFNWKLYGK